MNIKVDAIVKTKAEINPIDVIMAIKNSKFSEDSFVRDNKIYSWIDVGYHKSEYEESFVSDNPDDVEMLLALNTLLKLLK